ncbi:hypothetical protein AM493_19825 [Flavobacterium akiainvivens]|uniref:Fibronectin type-III domain-containing protein n=1 Tax=Flavobacterium akiainvivens TaxID=1202724 RepID=A0A0N0RR37_9FLAO|nr:fibronectin type III domain-containing protein [Flavobacterium akiainvivens]KOS08049.1 hypothetical protein AM493_19825 [Flavobacterium akiainvivens]SFQ62330.1 Por secretion system C-terminal sorting domain-containing protein [Flavobacterium akiainvivens]
MKKFTFLIALLLVSLTGFGQVSYNYGWEPTGLGSWVEGGSSGWFSRNTAAPCTGTGAVRANTYYNGTSTLRSPNLGTSNGGPVTLGYAYKALLYGSTTQAVPAAEVSLQVQYASSTTGPWTTVQVINSANHNESASCSAQSVTFTPATGDLYVRFIFTAVGEESDIHYYLDDIAVSQGAVPSCLAPTALASSSVAANSAVISFTASASAPSGGYEYYRSTTATVPAASVTATGTITSGATISGLTPLTTYYVFVRSICGADSVSAWSAATTFSTPASCLPPTAFTLTGLGSATASFGWTPAVANPGSGYDYYLSTSSTAPTATVTVTGTQESGATLALNNLTPDTQYYIWVRSNCGGGDTSVWTSSISFRTDCTASMPVDTVETFASYTGAMPGPSCWREGTGILGATPITLTGSSSTWTNGTYNNTTGHANGTAVTINLYGADNEWFVSPPLDLGTTVDYQLEYSASVVPWSATTPVTNMGEKFVKVVVSTDGGATWSEANVIKTYDNSNIPSTSINEIISLANYTGTVKIGFYAYSTTTAQDLRFYIDNFKVSPIPQCSLPVSPVFVSATDNAAVISWTAPATAPAQGYEYYVGTTNTAPAATATATGNVGAGVTTANLSNLTPITTYYVWVRSKCTATLTSEWVGPVMFGTLCDSGEVLTTTPDSVCGQGAATLEATANTGATIKWYAAAAGGTALATGASFTTPVITATTNYYVSAGNASTGVDSTVGAGVSTSDTYSNPFYSLWSNNHTQHLITAAELQAAGLTAGNINSVALDVTAAGSLPMIDLTIKIGTSNATAMTAFVANDAFQTVYTGASYMPTTGVNTFVFTTPYNWDGTSNIVVEFCHGNSASSSTMNRMVKTDATPYVSTVKFHTSDATAANVACGATTGTNLASYSVRPQFIFNGAGLCMSARQQVVATVTAAPAVTVSATDAQLCPGESTQISVTSDNDDYTYVWMPGNLTGATQTVSPTATTVYTVTATDAVSGCVNASQSVTITVNPLPTPIVAPATVAVCEGGLGQITATGGVVTSTVFAENFNAASTQFSVAATTGTATADLNTTYFAEGTGSVRFNTASAGANVNYNVNSNINLSGYTSAQLTFTHIAAMEGVTYSYDLGYVEYSTNGGTTWSSFPTSAYAGNGTLVSYIGTGTSSPVEGVAFSSKSYTDWNAQFTDAASTPGTAPAASLWKTETINIPAAALTSQFRVRFRYTTDGSVWYYGWMIDDVKVTAQSSQIVWSPAANLFTDAAGTQAYVAGTVSPTVYAAPTAAATYTASATNSVTGCNVSATVNVAVTVTPAPTADATQTFCGSATVADLDATGTTIQWYTAATGGTALTATTTLATGNYYATQTLNGCQSFTRTPVAVVVNITAAPTADAQSFCNAATVADLDATGAGIQWYAAATGGAALAADAALASGNYYASQTIDGCESVRTEVAVVVNVTAAPTADAQTFCNAATVADLDATGAGIQWYAAATGGTALAADAALASGNYYASQTVDGCESTARTEVAVVINVTAAPTADAQTFCNAAAVADLDATGTGIKWYAAATGGTALAADAALATGNYYASQTVDGCESAARVEVAVTVNVTPAVEGEVTQEVTIEQGETATIEDIEVTATGTVTWYATEADAIDGTNPLAVTTELVTGATYYAVQTIDGCTSADVLAVTITVTMGKGEFNAAAFSYYPNPVKDVVTVSYNKEITSVTVVNLLGQQVIKVAPNTTEVKIDMSGLAEGSYMLTVQSGNAVKTIKVIKSAN